MIVGNKCIRKRCKQEDIMVDLARRRWNWLGHACKQHHQGSLVLDTNRNTQTWAAQADVAWGEAAKIAQDRDRWRDLVRALCATWRKEA